MSSNIVRLAPPKPASAEDRYEAIVAKWRELGQCAAGIVPTKIGLEPFPEEVLAINEDLRVLARKVDALVQAYGEYAESMSGYRIDKSTMADQLSGALEGNLTFEIECAADDVHERNMEVVS